jgi:N-acetylmuramoyl-L-alanine amidase
MDIGLTEVDAWHRHRGFLMVGYHYIIKRDGLLETGRDADAVGARARGFNSTSISVSLVGGVTEKDVAISENNFTDAQWVTLEALIKQLTELYPDAEVLGHRDLPNVSKDCPAFDVEAWWMNKLN